MPLFPFLALPTELRMRIYRYVLVSELEYRYHPALWRPVAVDEKVFRIGYFRKNSVLPLLLANHQVHSEAIPVLYGENTFYLHISGFSDAPLAFLNRLPSKYLPLLRKVFVRTGYHIRGPVDRYLRVSSFPDLIEAYTAQKPEVKLQLRRQDVVNSAKLIKQAWPNQFKVQANCAAVISYFGRYEFEEEIGDLYGRDLQSEWVFSSWHLWKMMVIVSSADEPHFEFTRIVWDRPAPLLSV